MHRCTTGMLAVLTAAVILSGCSSDAEDGVPAATASSADPCAAADDLRGSLTALGDVQVVQEGTDALQQAWTTVQGDLDQLVADAGDRFADQVDSVQTAADGVRSALDSAQADPTSSTLRAAAQSVGVFVQAADTLVEEVQSAC